jgi:hypothetical protein
MGPRLQKLKANDPRPFNAPFDVSYPADFIAEGVDQTRGWFYTMHAISTLVFDQVAYKSRGEQRSCAGQERPEDEQAPRQCRGPVQDVGRSSEPMPCAGT